VMVVASEIKSPGANALGPRSLERADPTGAARGLFRKRLFFFFEEVEVEIFFSKIMKLFLRAVVPFLFSFSLFFFVLSLHINTKDSHSGPP
jgi:hypothetical protein